MDEIAELRLNSFLAQYNRKSRRETSLLFIHFTYPLDNILYECNHLFLASITYKRGKSDFNEGKEQNLVFDINRLYFQYTYETVYGKLWIESKGGGIVLVQKLNNHKVRIVFMFALSLMLTIGSVIASAKDYKLTMPPTEHSVIGDFVFIFKCDSVYYEWKNSGGTHGVGFGVYYFDGQSSTLIANKTAGSGNGGAWDSFTAPYTGNYFLKANCGGEGQTGCKGSGFIRYEL